MNVLQKDNVGNMFSSYLSPFKYLTSYTHHLSQPYSLPTTRLSSTPIGLDTIYDSLLNAPPPSPGAPRE
jgi:hypothetical protein